MEKWYEIIVSNKAIVAELFLLLTIKLIWIF